VLILSRKSPKIFPHTRTAKKPAHKIVRRTLFYWIFLLIARPHALSVRFFARKRAVYGRLRKKRPASCKRQGEKRLQAKGGKAVKLQRIAPGDGVLLGVVGHNGLARTVQQRYAAAHTGLGRVQLRHGFYGFAQGGVGYFQASR
jgi:hypothetical protein